MEPNPLWVGLATSSNPSTFAQITVGHRLRTAVMRQVNEHLAPGAFGFAALRGGVTIFQELLKQLTSIRSFKDLGLIEHTAEQTGIYAFSWRWRHD